MAVELETSRPFFSRQQTKEAIVEIAMSKRLVIFAGAGVTLDRSGLGWSEFVSGLLEDYIENPEQRSRVLETMRDLQSASVAAQLYQKDHGDSFRDRLTDRLRVLLYNGGQWQKGRLATNLATLLLVMNQKQSQDAEASVGGSCIVTPNYDDYIFQELVEVVRSRQTKANPDLLLGDPLLEFPTEVDPLSFNAASEGELGYSEELALAAWTSDIDFPRAADSTCIHLHGFVPRSHQPGPTGSASKYRHPVVSEQDYFITAEYSFSALKKLFSQASVLIVGASMTDPPLLRALAATADAATHDGRARYALVPMQDGLGAVDKAGLQKMIRERYQHFGVRPVFADYYGQAQQFIEEVTVCAQLAKPSDYQRSDLRYGKRLSDWWTSWSKEIAKDEETDWQWVFHEVLNAAVVALSELLDSSADEKFKLELWIRTSPQHTREMKLWATSLGTLADEALSRTARISPDTEYTSIQAFVAGRPVTRSLGEDDKSQRWRTYVGLPLTWKPPEGGTITVGAITIASMSAGSHSSLNSSANKHKRAQAIEFIEDLGSTLIAPSAEDWQAYSDELLGILFEDDIDEVSHGT